ncbi:MAG TPA: hypothetical protein PKV22_07605, partial [Paludibacteraceae bacterium]|nr:hypothetical protein [Paludibacteraceae bacterium]
MEQSLFRNLFEIPLKIIIFPMAAGILFLEREIERVSLSFRLSALGIFDASFNNRNKSKITLSSMLKGKWQNGEISESKNYPLFIHSLFPIKFF